MVSSIKKIRMSKLPKTFIICVENNKNKMGYIRFRSYPSEDGIKYEAGIVGDIEDASRYIGLDNTKREARKLRELYNFNNVSVLDEITKKSYMIQKKA
jgi:hypothetical protein